MPEKDDPTLYDVRVIKYHVRRGVLTPEQIQSHLDSLPDEAEHGVPTTTRFVSTFAGRNYEPAAED